MERPGAPNLEAKIDQKSIKNQRRFWHRFVDDVYGFLDHFGLHFGFIFEHFWYFFDPKGRSERKVRFSREPMFSCRFLMILRVSGDQNVIIVGLGGGFFDVQK